MPLSQLAWLQGLEVMHGGEGGGLGPHGRGDVSVQYEQHSQTCWCEPNSCGTVRAEAMGAEPRAEEGPCGTLG